MEPDLGNIIGPVQSYKWYFISGNIPVDSIKCHIISVYVLCFDGGKRFCVRRRPELFPKKYSTSYLVQYWSYTLFIIFDLSFRTVTTQIYDVAPMIVMSIWYDLGWKGQFKLELGFSVTALRKLHGFQYHGYTVTTGKIKTDTHAYSTPNSPFWPFSKSLLTCLLLDYGCIFELYML